MLLMEEMVTAIVKTMTGESHELREDINQLLMIKKNSNEKQYVDHISSLDEFIVNSLQERDTSSLVDGESSWEPLNEVFIKVIEKNSDDMF